MLAVSVAAVGLWRCSSYNYLRYKMVVEVETPEGVKTGFAVREIGLAKERGLVGIDVKFRGEAVAVDLPGGQTLFAVLRGGDGYVDYGTHIGGRAEVWGKSPDKARDAPVELYPTAPETAGLKHIDPLPMLVWFGDPADPASVVLIDPSDLAASFGPGVKLKQITIEATGDPVTIGINKRLRWLDHHTGTLVTRPIGGTLGDLRLEQRLNVTDFRRSAGNESQSFFGHPLNGFIQPRRYGDSWRYGDSCNTPLTPTPPFLHSPNLPSSRPHPKAAPASAAFVHSGLRRNRFVKKPFQGCVSSTCISRKRAGVCCNCNGLALHIAPTAS